MNGTKIDNLKELGAFFQPKSISREESNMHIATIREANKRHDQGIHPRPEMRNVPKREPLSQHAKAWNADDLVYVFHTVKPNVPGSIKEVAEHLGRAFGAIECLVQSQGPDCVFGRDFNDTEIDFFKSNYGQRKTQDLATTLRCTIVDIHMVAIANNFYQLNRRVRKHTKARMIVNVKPEAKEPLKLVQHIEESEQPTESVRPSSVDEIVTQMIAKRDDLRETLNTNPLFKDWVKLNHMISTFNKMD